MEKLTSSPSFLEPAEASGSAYCFLFKGNRLLVAGHNGILSIPLLHNLEKLNIESSGLLYLGSINNRPCYAAGLTNTEGLSQECEFVPLRELYSALSESLWQTAGLALHLSDWNKNSRHCSRCGSALVMKQDERAKICPACNRISYPRINPCVIAAVVKYDKILLARSSRFPNINLYSVLAGYVEPGETLRECVRREVNEETGIAIKNIQYFGSQAWPFSSSLMVGFTAEYAGGEIRIDEHEIVDAGWYAADDLPEVPRWGSIAGQLIKHFVEKTRR